MIKGFLKYYFVFRIVVLSVIVHSMAFSFSAFSENNSSKFEKSPLAAFESKIHTDFLSTSNSQIGNNRSSVRFCQKELNFDEITFKKVKFQNSQIVTSSAVHPYALKSVHDVVPVIPTYSYFESYYSCWYILYQVFRI